MSSQPNTIPQCVTCRVDLEAGDLMTFINVYHQGSGTWMPATAPKNWLGQKSVHSGLKVKAYRCPNCGRLELFAPPRKYNEVKE